MTAKQQLQERIETLSEDEAVETLRFLDNRVGQRRVPLDQAPLDDEGTTPEEEALVQEARDEIARGETVSLAEAFAEFGA